MLRKRIISILLVLVFILQLLPIRQAVKYFWVDNLTIEEVIHVAKNPVKPPTVNEEDHLMNEIYALELPGMCFILSMNTSDPVQHFRQHASEVETPPPNHFLS